MYLYSYTDQWEFENQDILIDDSGLDDAAMRLADRLGIDFDDAVTILLADQDRG